MVMTRLNSRTFHRFLYAGEMETVVLLKRNDDQQEGTVTAYRLFECRRGNISKTGQAIQGDMSSSHHVQWLIPNIMLWKTGVNYINVIDRIVDKYQMWWQPEAPQTITLSQFDNYTLIESVRVDPNPNQALLGNLGLAL